MTLKLVKFPETVGAVFKDSLATARGNNTLVPPEGGSEISLVLPHPVYTPRMRSMQSVSRLTRLEEPDYWQVVLRCADCVKDENDRAQKKKEYFATARVRERRTQRDKWLFTGFNRGNISTMIEAANGALASKTEVMSENTDYRLNLLVVTQPRLTAVWARTTTLGDDYVFALPESDAVWKTNGYMITLKELVEIAEQITERRESDF